MCIRDRDIGGVEKAIAEAYPDWSVRRAFTAQIIINHVQARDDEKIDNVDPVSYTHLDVYKRQTKCSDVRADGIGIPVEQPLFTWAGEQFAAGNALLFIGACAVSYTHLECILYANGYGELARSDGAVELLERIRGEEEHLQ